MNLSAFKNPLVIVSIVGAAILGWGTAYIGSDCSQARDQQEQQAREEATLQRFLTPSVPRPSPEELQSDPMARFR